MPLRGRYAKGAVKREEILDAATELFTRDGYDRTSMREVAREASLSQAGLLHYFPTKEELFVEVLRRRDDRNEHLYDTETGSPVTVDGLVRVVRHNAQEPALVRLYVAMSAESIEAASLARSFFESRYENLRRDVADDVRLQQSTGELVADLDADAIASMLIAAADGLQVQWLLDPSAFDMSERLEQMWTAFKRVC